MFRARVAQIPLWCLCGLCVVAVPLLMAHLGHLPLWDDEAHTALLARSILRTGLPLLWDGTNLISGVNGDDIGPDFLLTWDGPLQFYCTALAFRLFGESEFTARLPFVLAALITLPLTYLLANRLTRNAWIGVGSVALLLTSAPFLTHVRQCRYYSLSILFCTLLIYGYFGLGERRRDLGYFAAGGIALFYAHPISLVIVWFGCALHCAVARRRLWRPFLLGSALIAVPTLPWFCFAELYAKRGPAHKPGLARLLYLQCELTYKFNRFLFPMALWGALGCCWRRLRGCRHFIALCFVLYVGSILLIAQILPTACRYAIWFLPLGVCCGMCFVDVCWRRWIPLGVLSFLLLLGTNVWQKTPIFAVRVPLLLTATDYRPYRRQPLSSDPLHAVRKTLGRIQSNNAWFFGTDWWWKSLTKMDLAAYWHEITHPYRDPITGAVEFFRAHASPNDTALIAVDAFTLMYYCPWLRQAWMVAPRLMNWARLQAVPAYTRSFETIRWYVPRRIQRMKGPALSETAFVRWAYRRHLPFIRHTLPYSAAAWDGSRPETLEQYTRQHSPRLDPVEWTNNPVVIYEILRADAARHIAHERLCTGPPQEQVVDGRHMFQYGGLDCNGGGTACFHKPPR